MVFEIQTRYTHFESKKQWLLNSTEMNSVGAIEKAKALRKALKGIEVRVVPIEELWNSEWIK